MLRARKKMSEAQAAALSLGLEIATLEIRRAGDIVPAFESLKDHADALYVTADALLNANRFWREVETQKLEQLEARMDEIADRVARDRTNAARERTSTHEAQRPSH